LTTQIANDNNLLDNTNNDMETAVAERAQENQNYNVNVEELQDAIAALNECIQLVGELRNGASFV